MTTLTALASAHAIVCGRAQPTATVRHVHVANRPLVCVPLTMAGEANAPLAMMVGDNRDRPRLLVVPQPRDRDLRFAFADAFGRILLGFLGGFPNVTRPVPEGREVVFGDVEAPQVWLPNTAGTGFVRLFGRSTRFRSTEGRYAVPQSVPRAGRWLTFLAERAEIPGSSTLVAATEVLSAHWATGQSAVENANLATLMAWIDPPDGLSGGVAARAAEDPISHPPAGPSTDPTFDKEVLESAIKAYDKAADDVARRRAELNLEMALPGQLQPTWELVWQAIDLMRGLRPGEHVAGRWHRDMVECARHSARLQAGEPPQPKRDGAVGAAARLNFYERLQAAYDVERAFDDPLVMAEQRLIGKAFVGTVAAAEPDRTESTGRSRKLRPLITVRTEDPVQLVQGEDTVFDQARPKQKAQVRSLVELPDGFEVTLVLAEGMGNGRTPRPGTVPTVGDQVCYSTLSDRFQPIAALPAAEDTPWTHGGPPARFQATRDDAEDWS